MAEGQAAGSPSVSFASADRLGRLRDRALAVALVAAAAINFLAMRDFVFEDAYITFKYAASLAAGDGFVFNPGERVLGTSTPLLALLLGLLGAFGLDIPGAATALYAGAMSVAGWAGSRLLARRGLPNAGVFFALAVVSGAGGIFEFFGMETALHVALIFFAFLLATTERPWLLGCVLGLIALNRYDGVIPVAVVLLCRWLATRRLPWREAVVAGAFLASWLLFARFYFGDFLPNTYTAKADEVPFATFAWGSVEKQAEILLPPLFRLEPLRLPPWCGWLAAALLLLPAFWRGAWWLADRVHRRPGAGFDLAPLALVAVLLWLGYSTIGPSLGFYWYLTPGTYCVLALGFAAWAPWLARVPPRLRTGSTLLAIAGALALLPWAIRREAAASTTPYMTIGAYAQFAQWIRHQGLSETTVLTREPGYLTYLSGQRAIDAAGLITRGLYYQGPAERRSDFFELVSRFKPEFLIWTSPLSASPAHLRAGYQRMAIGTVGRSLWLRNDLVEQHLPAFDQSWQRGDYYQGPPAALRHPIAFDFGSGAPPPPFMHRQSQVTRLPELRLAGQPFGEPVLTTHPSVRFSAAWTEPFAIDFDQLAFLYGANHESLTAAQLWVDGLLAWERKGRSEAGGPTALTQIEHVELPLHGWQGRTGVLAFVLSQGNKGVYAADHIVSQRSPRRRVVDDFEKGAWDSALWATTFGTTAPTTSLDLARRIGLHPAQGRFAATSLQAAGPQHLESRPFQVDHQRLSFTVLDFGDAQTTIELSVGGEVRHRYTGTGKGLDLVVWDLKGLEGQQATLRVRDDAPAPEVGIGIDTIVLYDEAPKEPAAGEPGTAGG